MMCYFCVICWCFSSILYYNIYMLFGVEILCYLVYKYIRYVV